MKMRICFPASLVATGICLFVLTVPVFAANDAMDTSTASLGQTIHWINQKMAGKVCGSSSQSCICGGISLSGTTITIRERTGTTENPVEMTVQVDLADLGTAKAANDCVDLVDRVGDSTLRFHSQPIGRPAPIPNTTMDGFSWPQTSVTRRNLIRACNCTKPSVYATLTSSMEPNK